MDDANRLVELSSDDEAAPRKPETSMLASIGQKFSNKLKRRRSRGGSTKSTPSNSEPPSPLKKTFKDDCFEWENDVNGSCTKCTRDGTFSSRTFTYSKDFDKNGIVYYIGKDGRSAFVNPAESLQVMITHSDHGTGDVIGCPEDITARKSNVFFRTKNGEKSWICFDLGRSRAIVPTRYSLRHGGADRNHALQHWRFEGSETGASWTPLKVHYNEEVLQRRFGSATWQIDTQKGTPVRYLRILQTGPNASGSFELSLGGFEVYGTLYEDN